MLFIMGKTHRPINERIAETQAQLAQLLARQAKVEVSQDPQIQELDARIKDLNAQLVKLNRWETDAEEKYANFIKRAEAWQVKGAEGTA
jgi:chaperonin cofactor prefoldin